MTQKVLFSVEDPGPHLNTWFNGAHLDIRWHDFVKNADIRRITNQPPLSSIIKSSRLTFFGHLARMDENADAS